MPRRTRASSPPACPRATSPGGSAAREGRTPGCRPPRSRARRRARAACPAGRGCGGPPRGSSGSSASRCGSADGPRPRRGTRSSGSRPTWARTASRSRPAVPSPSGRAEALRGARAGEIAWVAVSQEAATAAEEEYLQTIFWLEEAGLPITAANIARAMQLSAPTVHEMVGRLESDGYVTRADDKSLSFTGSGRDHASQIVRRHRLIERFLTDVLKIPWDEVHEEAERLEHAMSPTLEERMLAAIGDAKTCPHGHPIVAGGREEGVPLADVEEGAKLRILRFENEAEDLLHYLKEAGLHPGLEGTLTAAGEDEVAIESNGSRHVVTRSVAETVSVTADPSPPPRVALPEQLVLGKERYGR